MTAATISARLMLLLAFVMSCVAGLRADDTRKDVLTVAYGETIYVPAVSRIFTDEKRRQLLASTLIVHNVDPSNSIELISVRYYDQAGILVRNLLEEPRTLAAYASTDFLTELSDTRGGVGANYIVEWRSTKPALSPIAEAVMIGGTGTNGISFTSRGRVIARRSEP